jgi:hypothetical protein
MPNQKHLRGVTRKEQRVYEQILNNAKKSGLYGKQAKEIAARLAFKNHR